MRVTVALSNPGGAVGRSRGLGRRAPLGDLLPSRFVRFNILDQDIVDTASDTARPLRVRHHFGVARMSPPGLSDRHLFVAQDEEPVDKVRALTNRRVQDPKVRVVLFFQLVFLVEACDEAIGVGCFDLDDGRPPVGPNRVDISAFLVAVGNGRKDVTLEELRGYADSPAKLSWYLSIVTVDLHSQPRLPSASLSKSLP